VYVVRLKKGSLTVNTPGEAVPVSSTKWVWFWTWAR
jgi:hypothetical protein